MTDKMREESARSVALATEVKEARRHTYRELIARLDSLYIAAHLLGVSPLTLTRRLSGAVPLELESMLAAQHVLHAQRELAASRVVESAGAAEPDAPVVPAAAEVVSIAAAAKHTPTRRKKGGAR